MLERAKRAARAALEAWRRAASARHVRHSAPHVTRAALAAGLARLGIAQGETLFIHSSLKSLGYVEGGAQAVIRALQDAVGPQGTLLLPTYYLPGGTVRATCAMPDYVFDPRRHGTHMGRLPEAFLASAGVRRSIHPTHSVSAWGRHAAGLTEAHHRAPSIFGMDSPWQRFIGCDHAKVLGLGISMGPVTFYHALEDAMGDAFPVPVWEDDTKLLAWTTPASAGKCPCALSIRPSHSAASTIPAVATCASTFTGNLTPPACASTDRSAMRRRGPFRHRRFSSTCASWRPST